MGRITDKIKAFFRGERQAHPLANVERVDNNRLVLQLEQFNDTYKRTNKSVRNTLKTTSQNARADYDNVFRKMNTLTNQTAEELKAQGRQVSPLEREMIEATDLSDENKAKEELVTFQSGDNKAIRRVMFNRFKNAMTQLRNNPQSFRTDISMTELATAFPRYLGVLNLSVYDVDGFDALASQMENGQELTQEEKDLIPGIREAFVEIKKIHGVLDKKFSILTNPLFPLVGEGIFGLDKAEELTKNFSKESVLNPDNHFLDLQEDLYQWFVENQKLQYEQWKSRFGDHMQMYSPETGGIDDIEAVTSKPSQGNEKILSKKIYVRSSDANAKWILMERQNNGAFERKEVPAAEQAAFTAEYRERKANEAALTHIAGRLQGELFASNNKRIPRTAPAANGLWLYLKEYGEVYVRDQGNRKITKIAIENGRVTDHTISLNSLSLITGLAIKRPEALYSTGLERIGGDMSTPSAIWNYLKDPTHSTLYYQDPETKNRHSLSLAGEEIISTAISDEQWKAISNEWAGQYVAGHEDVGAHTRERLAAEHFVPGAMINEIYHNLYDFRTRIKNNTTGILHSSDAYRDVEYALDRVLKNMPNMSRTDLVGQLYSIHSFAQKYCNGKTERDLQKAYTRNRVEGMRDLQTAVMDYISDIRRMDAVNLPIRTPEKTLDDHGREELSMNLRRAMRNVPFNKQMFSAWKALENFDVIQNATAAQRKAETWKIENSRAVRFMEEHLQGNITDEKQLNRYYETFRAVEERLALFRNLDRKKLYNNYKRVMELDPSVIRSGNPDFDREMFKHFKTEMRRIARNKGMDVRENFEIRDTVFDDEYNSFTSRKLAMAYEESFKNTIFSVPIKEQERIKGEVFDRICQEVFGTSDNETQKMYNKFGISGDRRRAWFLMLGMLVEKGVEPEDIFTPGKKADVKREIGRSIQQQMETAKTEEQKQVVTDRFYRAVMDNCLKLYDYVYNKYNDLDRNNPESYKKYLQKTAGIADGIYDQVFQVQFKVKGNRWEQKDLVDTYKRIYPHQNESFEAMKARLDYLVHVSRDQADLLLAEDKLGTMIAQQKEGLTEPEKEKGVGGIKNDIAKMYGVKFFTAFPEYLSLENMENNENRAFYNAIAFNTFSPAFVDNVLGNISDFGKILLAQSESSRFRVEFNKDAYYQKKDEEKQARLASLQEPGFVKVFLKTEDNTEREISWKLFTKGIPENEEEKEFIEKFRDEIMTIADQKEDECERKIMQEFERKVDAMPEAFKVYKDLLKALPKDATDIQPYFEHFSKINSEEFEAIDPFECVVIGGVNGKKLLQDEFEKLNISYDQTSKEMKSMVMTALCVAAIANGNPVAIASSSAQGRGYGFDKMLANYKIKLPTRSDNLTIEKKAALNKVWNSIKGGGLAEDGHSVDKIHKAMLQDLEKKLRTCKDRQTMSKRNVANAIETMNQDKVTELGKTAEEFKKALTETANEKGIYKFANNMELSASTAILLIAYAGVKNAENENVSCIPAGERIRLPFEQHKNAIEAATAKFNEIAGLRNTDRDKADKSLRGYILKGLNNMNLQHTQPVGNLEEYASNYAGMLRTMNEAISFIAKDTAGAGIGKGADQKKPIIALIGEREIMNDRDMAGMEYLELARSLNKVYNCEKISKYMEKAEKALGRYLYMSKQLGNETKNINLHQLSETFNMVNPFTAKLIDEKKLVKYDENSKYIYLEASLNGMNDVMNHKDETYTKICECVQHDIQKKAEQQAKLEAQAQKAQAQKAQAGQGQPQVQQVKA